MGTAVLLALPELARPLADYRTLVYGLIMVLVMGYLPRGVYDTFVEFLYRRRIARMDRAAMANSQGVLHEHAYPRPGVQAFWRRGGGRQGLHADPPRDGLRA